MAGGYSKENEKRFLETFNYKIYEIIMYEYNLSKMIYLSIYAKYLWVEIFKNVVLKINEELHKLRPCAQQYIYVKQYTWWGHQELS